MLVALIPDATQVSLLLSVAVIATLCVGLGCWTGARRVETALVAGWGIAGLATVAVGTLSSLPLSPVLIVLGLVGAAGLGRVGAAQLRGLPILEAGLFGRVLLLAVPLFAVTASMQTTAWDDFSHWLPNLAYLCVHDHFPTLAQPSLSYHAAYPYGLALPGLVTYRLFELDPDNVALVWNQVLILAAAASIAHVLRQRVAHHMPPTPWICAALGLLFAGIAAPSFVSKIVFSNMADSATGGVMAVLLGIAVEWCAAPAEQRARQALVFALGCVALLNLRQANGALYGLLLLGLVLAGLRNRGSMRQGAGVAFAAAIVLPLGTALLWSHYAKAQIPGGEFSFMPLADWRWPLLGRIVGSMVEVMTSKIGLFGLILVLVIRAVMAFRPADRLLPWQRLAVIAGAFTALGMIGFLGLAYLAADFNVLEAVAAASFWRYMGEVGPMAVLAVAAVAPIPAWRKPAPRTLAIALAVITLVAPVAAVRMLRADLESPVPHLQAISQDLARAVPASAPLALVDFNSDGFPLLVLNYDLLLSTQAHHQPPRTILRFSEVQGMLPAAAARLDLSHAAFLWLAEGSAQAGERFGVPLGSGCSYLLRHADNGYVVAARWPIGRYRWATFPNGWTPAPDPACS